MNFNLPSSNVSIAPIKVAFIILFIMFCHSFAASYGYSQITQLSASVDRNAILLDESFQLTVVASGTGSRDDLDFSGLQNNFRVSTPSFSQSTQIINGSMSRTVSWTVSLYPRQTGTFTIPSFAIDGQSSQGFTVKVMPVDTAAGDQPREFYVTATIDNETSYLQQQISYKVKIHLSRDIQRGQLSLPELEGAIIQQIGEDEDYQEIIDGVRYRIIERSYALIPQSSGSFTIKGPIFEAEISTNSRRSFANFGRSKTIARRAPDLQITVRPIPDSYTDTWLPSEMVEISEQWQGPTEPFTVGEPVTRTITLTALGLTKEQLPAVTLPYHPSFKVYPEQPNLATVERNNKLIAQGVFNSAIIPEEAGNFVLPEARIPWFNVKTGQTEFAILPARSVTVKEKVADASNFAQTPIKQTNQNDQDSSIPIVSKPELSSPSNQGFDWLHVVLLSINIFLLIALYVLWLSRKKASSSQTLVAKPTLVRNEDAAFKEVKSLLEQGKTKGLQAALEAWLRQLLSSQYYSISASLAAFPDAKALEQYNLLLGNNFSNTQHSIDFMKFIQSLEQVRLCYQSNKREGALATLYP